MDSTIALSLILQGLALGLTAAFTPGPFQAFLINQTLNGGWRRAAPIAFAPLIGDGPVVLLVILVLNQFSIQSLPGVSLAGGLFVLYLAFGLWRQWRRPSAFLDSLEDGGMPSPEEAGIQKGRMGRLGAKLREPLPKGVLMNLLSPGPYTFWALVSGPILLSALDQSIYHGIAFISSFYLTLIGGMLGIAILFHQARRLGPQVIKTMTLISIVILMGFGFLLIGQGILAYANPEAAPAL